MMKTTTTIGLLCLSVMPAVARRLNDSVYYMFDLSGGTPSDVGGYTFDQPGSLQFGYDHAEYLWGEGLYDCKGITRGYWLDVQDSLFPVCDSEWSEFALDCKSGCEQFTLEQMGNCFEVEDCSNLGLSASSAVAGSFCQREGLFHELDWLPSKCRLHAETSCKSDAVNLIQEFKASGVCTTVVTASSLDYLDEIHTLCEQEVYEMEQAATLVWF